MVCYVNVEVDGGDGDTDTRRSRGHEGKKRDRNQVDGNAAWWWGVDDSERRDWVERDDVDVGVNLSRFWPGRSGFGRKAGWVASGWATLLTFPLWTANRRGGRGRSMQPFGCPAALSLGPKSPKKRPGP